MKNIRRYGNIALVACEYDKGIYYEIVKFEPNPYYGAEQEYKYNKDENFYYKEDEGMRILPACFKNTEICYVIASLDVDKHEYLEHNIISVGNRPFELNEDEMVDYIDICKYTYETDKWIIKSNSYEVNTHALPEK